MTRPEWFPLTVRHRGEHSIVWAGMRDKFRYLKVSLALVLLVGGVKMLVAP